MHRNKLLQLLHSYTPWDEHEQGMLDHTVSFVEEYPNCFDRKLDFGHVTGSAWIVDPTRSKVVMIHHRKLDRWFQPGGHSDGDPNTPLVALKEAQEETGLKNLTAFGPGPFDIDVHTIPQKNNEPAHYHFDIRFLFESPADDHPALSPETKAVTWLPLEEALIRNPERSIERMLEKTRTTHFLARFEPFSIS